MYNDRSAKKKQRRLTERRDVAKAAADEKWRIFAELLRKAITACDSELEDVIVMQIINLVALFVPFGKRGGSKRR